MTQHTIQNFNVIDVPLSGKNLIEASAGTGKTYSIAVMTVRLVIEQSMKLEEILLVTFTEKAVAELQIRVRKFIRDAYNYSVDPLKYSNIDSTLKEIVNKHLELAEINLAKAIIELDMLNIFTIHSFCQKTLTEFAFYTNETFEKELVPDISDYLHDYSKDFIREKFYGLDLEILNELKNLYSEIFNPATFINFITQAKTAEIQNYDSYIDFYLNNNFTYKPEKVVEIANRISENELSKEILNIFFDLKQDATIQKMLSEQNVYTFDDLIINLHNNITKELVAIFKLRIKALFIDEFQDTDHQQYNIFKQLFTTQTIFFIGDPKQAIYSFRNADINTYFMSKDFVDNIYNLNTNYRSTVSLVEGINSLFNENNSCDDFNPFHFPVTDAKIKHSSIKANNQEKDYLTYNGEVMNSPFCIIENDSNLEQIADDILAFLTYARHNEKTISPNQVAVLAKTNSDLRDLKKLLAFRKIPAVVVTDDKIFQTEEANLVNNILRAITTRSAKDISAILNNSIFNLSLNELNNIDYAPLINQFYEYYKAYQNNGLYDTLMSIYNDLNIENNCQQHINNDVQFWANLNQIAEQLQHVQRIHQLSLEELIIKMKQPSFATEDTYQTRIESDEQAVQLLTIHKSKGLEFDYLFTTNLNFGTRNSYTGFFKYYDPEKKQFNLDLSLSNIGFYNDYFMLGMKQEFKRLIYVALTRAKYGLFAYYKPNKKRPYGAFHPLIVNCSSPFISKDFAFIGEKQPYASPKNLSKITRETTLKVTDKNWKKMSFSFLNHYHGYTPTMSIEYEYTPYDKFIFEELTKGVDTGHLIHNIFEYMDFNNPEQWKEIIHKSLSIFEPNKLDLYKDNLLLFAKHVLNASIKVGEDSFKLLDVNNNTKVSELEFDLVIKNLQTTKIHDVVNDKIKIALTEQQNLHGLLNGLIDLVFEHNGKYYILDWKTNFLGNSTADYNQEKMQEAMTNSNYHLQYCIYTVALKKFLESRIKDFDYSKHFGGVIYLFVRGIRENQNTGIYTNYISLEDVSLLEEVFS